MTKRKYKLAGMHCTSCAMVVEGELEDNLNVSASCDWVRQVVEVEFDPDRVDHAKIVQIIEAQGYKVVGEG